MRKLGFIGGGDHGVDGHWRYAQAAGFQVVKVCDPRPDDVKARLHKAGIAYGHVRWFGKLGGPFWHELDAVLIASPDEDHPIQLAAAIEAGVHVLVEKPAAVEPAGLRLVKMSLDGASRKKLIVSSCHPRRFDPPYVALRETYGSLVKKYGPLVHITMDFSYPAPGAGWKGARSLLLYHFPHEYDWMRWLLDTRSVVAWQLHDGFDHYGVAGTFTGREQVSFTCSGTRQRSRPNKGRGTYPETVVLRFATGSCELDTLNGVLTTWSHDAPSKKSRASVGPTDYNKRFERIMQDFATAIERGGGGYLSHDDIYLNTQAAVMLAGPGRYVSP